ncbi:hypothetical protein BOW53_01330 [Solemya pervernicosa gill symbiont]|uniref:Lipoprotein n=1 Tax=Solemya pervernicosa gill symbiont TaxID=642797 RepID=A0A1T2LA73_9GAMM|nr:hypothetical protein [Solemya pervernicosa gill symbiont]OOZ42008.1 hypothetical protein BOW53_01330 [Solemya pervernicosa gill symbiont]
MKTALLLTAIASTLLLSGCNNDQWHGFVYTDRYDLSNYAYVGNYETLKECRIEVVLKMKASNRLRGGDYECGFNCKRDKNGKMAPICESSSR